MADTALVSNARISSVDTVTTLYTAPADGNGAVITAFTATNCITAGVSFKAYIISSGGSVGCPVIPFTIVGKDKGNPGSLIVNQVVPAGGTIRAENSTANGLNFYITGEEQAG